MATHIEAQIPDALIEHFDTITLPTGVSVAYPGINFKPTKDEGYVRLQLLKNEPIQPRIRFGNEPIRQGIFQASVFWPEGAGIIKPSEVAGTIRDAFARGTKIDGGSFTIRIDQEPTVGSDIQEKAWLQIPVSVPWIVYS